MIKFIHAADIHLDSRLEGLSRYEGAPVERIRDASRRAFENLIRLAIEEQVAFVLLAGDIYDRDWLDYNTGLYFIAQMSRLREAGVRVFLITGNHDAANRMTKALRLPENVTMLATSRPETHILDDLGFAIHGQGFATAAVTEDISRHYPPARRECFNIGMLHTSVEGTEGHDRYAPCTLEGLKTKGYDYWALGHIHKRDTLADDPHIVYSGNIQGRHIRETGPKGCMVAMVDGGRLIHLDFHRLDVVRWEVCDISGGDLGTEDELYERADDRIAGLLGDEEPHRLLVVRVVLRGKSRLHERLMSNPRRFAAEIRSRAIVQGIDRVWVERVKIQTLPWHTDSGQGPIEELLAGLAGLRSDDASLLSAAACLSDLRDRLPVDLLALPDAPRFDDRTWLLGILDEVEALLRTRLAPSESGR